MSQPLWKNLTKQEIVSILDNSETIGEVIHKIGYKTRNGHTRKEIDKMLDFYNLVLPDYERSRSLQRKLNETKICEICGNEFVIDILAQRARKYCYKCSPSTNNPTIKTKAMKSRVVEMKGGKCEKCGYDKCIDALELHHLDPSTKDFNLANTGAVPSFEKYLEEANKCILLCANCHREEHWRLRQENMAEN